MRGILSVSVMLVGFASVLATATPVSAADSAVGTWVRTDDSGKLGVITLTIDAWGKGGCKLTYRFKGSPTVMTVASPMDGTDAPVLVNGKASGQTMAIRLVDKHHASTEIKMNGKQFGTSRATLSDDFSKMTVENEFTEATPTEKAGKRTEVWVRK
jgi:hypothetical protein